MRRYSLAATLGTGLVLLIAVVWFTYRAYYARALEDTAQKATVTAQLQAQYLLSAVEKFEHLPHLVGAERTLSDLLRSPHHATLVEQANHYLSFAKDRTEVAAIYLIDTDGNTLAASNWQSETSYVGQNYRFRPYFQEAVAGRSSLFYGIGVTTGTPGAFIAAPLLINRQIRGVVAVKIDLTPFETQWRKADLQIAMTDALGVIFLTTQPDWRYRSLQPLSAATMDRLRSTRQYGDVALQSLASQNRPLPVPELQALDIDRRTYLLKTQDMGRFDWQMLLFSDPAEPRRKGMAAAEIAGLSLALVYLSLALVWQYRRRQTERRESQRALARIAAELDQRIAARTAELTAANDIAVQTGKLAVLGQMAASISHEISQPLTALRTLADNANSFLARNDAANASDNLRIIGELCTRMGSIVGELKAFARKEPVRLQDVSVRQVVAGALMLVEPLRKATATQVRVDGEDFLVRGDPIRLEQVLVNLLRNAMDAMEAQSERSLDMQLRAHGEQVEISVRDHGPGLSADVLEHLFEPFFTTKPSGKGLGLGLSLSHAIVHEMGGSIHADNANPGAVFRIHLPRVPAPPCTDPDERTAH
jgi:two-component system C4-dicarboxylate transport sensor histidine kinase DctB